MAILRKAKMKKGARMLFIIAIGCCLMVTVAHPMGKELVLKELGRFERCTICHARITDPAAATEKQPQTAHPGKFFLWHPPEKFGCIMCHGGRGEATKAKEAHSDAIYTSGAINPLDDPQPYVRHFLKGTEAQGTCLKCHEDVFKVSEAESLRRGAYYFLYNCAGCHQVSGLEPQGKIAPPLTYIRWKVSKDWAIQILKNPRQVQPKARMPNFFLKDEEIKPIVDYLFSLADKDMPKIQWEPILLKPRKDLTGEDLARWDRIFQRGQEIWEEAQCSVCHSRKGEAALVEFDLAPSLEKVADKVNRDWLYLWLKGPRAYNHHTRMPQFKFSDEDIRALIHYIIWDEHFTEGAKNETQFSQKENPSPEILRRGKELISYYGCAGCHDIKGHEEDFKIGASLNDIGAKPLDQLNFDPGGIPRTRQAWLTKKLMNPHFTQGTTLRNARMPDMNLSREQLQDLMALMMGLTGEMIPISLKTLKPSIRKSPPVTPEILTKGKELFQRYCAKCHGDEGKGDGLGAKWFEFFPRDLTTRMFRSQSTPCGYPPTSQDLFITLTIGMPGSAMPPFGSLPVTERWLLVQYVQSLFKSKEIEMPEITISQEPLVSAQSLKRGKELFMDLECFKCHGEDGKGLNREEGFDWIDERGRPIPRSADLRSGIFKTSFTGRDIYRILMTGMCGSPMPSYADSITEEADRWALVHYIQSFFRKNP